MMKMILTAIALAIAAPAAAQTADPHANHTGHPAAKAAPDAHAGHSTAGGPAGAADPHAGHAARKGCCEKKPDGSMSCCEGKDGETAGKGCCKGKQAQGAQADPHAGHDMSSDAAHSGHGPTHQ